MTTFRRELTPAGSHLSLAVYSTRKSTEAVFRTMLDLVRDSVESSARYVEVAPRSVVDDESVDVQRVLTEVDFGENGVPADLLTDPGQVPRRAYVSTKQSGWFVLDVFVWSRSEATVPRPCWRLRSGAN